MEPHSDAYGTGFGNADCSAKISAVVMRFCTFIVFDNYLDFCMTFFDIAWLSLKFMYTLTKCLNVSLIEGHITSLAEASMKLPVGTIYSTVLP